MLTSAESHTVYSLFHRSTKLSKPKELPSYSRYQKGELKKVWK
jgi:hypothetical protein